MTSLQMCITKPTSIWSQNPPQRGEPYPQFARVTKRPRDSNGLLTGKARDKPTLDMRIYEVEYMDGDKYSLSANLIIENMFAQIYEEGNHHVLMDDITNYWLDEATVKIQDAFVTISSDTKCRRQITQGVSICIKYT